MEKNTGKINSPTESLLIKREDLELIKHTLTEIFLGFSLSTKQYNLLCDKIENTLKN